MVRSIKIIGFIVAVFVCYNCERRQMVEKSLNDFISDTCNHLIKESSLSSIKVKVQYKPLELVFKNEIKRGGVDIAKLRSEYKDVFYFILSFSYEGKDLTALNDIDIPMKEVLQEISYALRDKIYLTSDNGKEKIKVSDYLYSRMYGTTASTSVLLSFKDKKIADSESLSLYIPLFENCTVVNFKMNEILNTPKLNYL